MYLVGTGLAEGDLSLNAAEACKRSRLFVEHHTSFISDSYLKEIERLAGRHAERLERNDLEEKSATLAKLAAKEDVAVLIGGDPLIATTHKILFIEAKRAGAKVRVIHSSSVFSAAIGESGLDFYRFGQVCTIPAWSEHYKPVSFYETIEKNLSMGLHSLVLLDYISALHSSIPVKDALSVLEEAEKHYKKRIVKDSMNLIVLHNLSQEDERRVMCTLSEAKTMEFGTGGRTVIIVPAKLQDIESETIKSMY